MTVFEDKVCKNEIKVEWGYDSEALAHIAGILITRWEESRVGTHRERYTGLSKKAAICKPRREVSPEPTLPTFNLGILDSRFEK